MTVLVILLVLLVCALLVTLFLKQRPRQTTDENASPIAMMQQQIEALRTDLRSSLQHVTDNLAQQLAGVSQQLQSQTQSVGNRLDNAARVIGDVQKNLGELGKATEEIKELGMSVSKLEELLRAPKLRGGLGEYLLEDLLKQILPAEHVEMQYRFRSGAIVDAVIRTSDRMVPIDAKFPLENFRKMMTTNIDTEKKTFQKAFVSDVKKHIDAIATKYILPDEGTFPFALMYIPAENIYYEIIIKDELSNDAGIYNYALNAKLCRSRRTASTRIFRSSLSVCAGWSLSRAPAKSSMPLRVCRAICKRYATRLKHSALISITRRKSMTTPINDYRGLKQNWKMSPSRD